jgi:putative ABC transport system permease protein
MFVLSGVWMVASAVWVLMYNADIIAAVVQATIGNNHTLRPILKPAIAYPTSFRFRTGLTVAMFALVIFTMMVFSILNNAGSDIIETPWKANGGFEVRAETTAELPITDLNAAIAATPALNSSDFSVIAASTDLPAEARQDGADEIRYLDVPVRGVDENYLRYNEFELSHFDSAYVPEGIDREDRQAIARAIWDQLATDPTLAVVSNGLLATPVGGGPAGFGGGGFRVEGIAQDDPAEITAFDISIRGLRGQGETVQRKAIAAVDPFAGAYESQDGNAVGVITTSAAIFDEISDTPVPFTVFRMKLTAGADPGRVAAAMETAFLDNGLLATDTLAEIKTAVAQNNAFGRLFQAFMGLGLVVGVASLGVLSFRAVVERRLSIGMMRAIGYKSRMIQVQFLLESVFVTMLGTALGIGLGALISWNIVNSIQERFDGLSFNIPWMTVTIIVVIAVVAALLTTFIPARQASKIYPSEALRYE